MLAPAARCARTASAEVLVALLACGAHDESSEAVRALDGLDAFDRLGVCRDQVLRQVEARRDGAGDPRSFAALLTPVQRLRAAGTLSVIDDEAQRLLLCRLAAAVVTADGRVEPEERRLVDHLLDTWRLRRSDVAAAIRADPLQ